MRPKHEYGNLSRQKFHKTSNPEEFKSRAENEARKIDFDRDDLVDDLKEAQLKLDEARLRANRLERSERRRGDVSDQEIIESARADVFSGTMSLKQELQSAADAILEAERNVVLARQKLDEFDQNIHNKKEDQQEAA
jgi:hypothetical protein